MAGMVSTEESSTRRTNRSRRWHTPLLRTQKGYQRKGGNLT